MSVIIKGMDMPKKGVYHAVITFDGDSLGVRIPPSKKPFFSGRIVHIPTPHGRLIDAAALVNRIENNYCNKCTIVEECGICACQNCGVDTLFDEIENATTIIEAEVSE